ncbi:DUF808 domain-containing protein [Flavobacterium sp. RHBU_3]|uniref:DUF808 domain-containing protein n=1 Tax=Flavobacterium sp. RHBU_3 TaxID=3391184 RepID=UPI003985141B
MASGFFAILDDIASLMDDVAATSKLATGKTAGILGDDLAVNAEKATGFVSSRELPVLWAITKGSLLNKVILIPIILLLNAFFPVAIKIVLVIGGFYLAYEGVEKIVEYVFHHGHDSEETAEEENQTEAEAEKSKIKSAITTDFILSLEIVIIALSTVLDKPLGIQIMTVCITALLATIGVYGIVALIVRMDDAGFSLIRASKNKGFFSKLGNLLVKALPWVIKALGVIGTVALIMVSGGIFVHSIEYLHHLVPGWPSIVKEVLVGLVGGFAALIVITAGKKVVALVKK